MREFLPIILGSDENAYACARMFYEINGEKSLVFCSRGLAQTAHSGILWRYVIEDFDTQPVFEAVMTTAMPKLKNHVRRILLVPCSDYYAELVIRNAEFLKKYVDSPLLSEDIYDKFRDKITFSELCSLHNISHPKTEILLPSHLASLEINREYPLVMKPANSNSAEYLHLKNDKFKKVYFCKNSSDLKRFAECLIEGGYNKAVVLQKYINGSSLVVNAYCDKRGRVRVIGAGQPLLEYQNDQLIGNYAAIRTVNEKRLCDIAADFLEAIHYVGFANFDIKVDSESGEYVFLELNPRQGRSSYFLRVAGENLMKTMYEDVVEGMPYTKRRYVEGNGVWINEPIGVIKREMKRYGLDANEELRLGKSALDITYDFSLPRAATLLKRKIGAYLRPI